MYTLSNKRNLSRLIHLLFWLLLGGILLAVYQEFVGGWKAALVPTLINLSGLIALAYIHIEILIPRYFNSRRYGSYIGLLVATLLLTSTFRFFVGSATVEWLGWDLRAQFNPNYFIGMVLSGGFVVLISIPLQLVDSYFKKAELEQALTNQQLEAELRFLRAQVNPHFLFNVLNNIYSLSFTQSPLAPEMILKLSGMMSYMLYDCKTDQVKLSDEIQYLENFIALHQLKKEGDMNVVFETEGNLAGISITPMLFIPFFENAFKHGNLEDLQNGWLKSKLSVENGSVSFVIQNTFSNLKSKHEKGGVGLENTEQRLALLYPDRHQLSISTHDDIFHVALELEVV
ncbi:MAG: sensor histidine kinase [Bacteroidia bacterium]